MFLGYFTERPYQDEKSGYYGNAGRSIDDLNLTNGAYDAHLAANLFNRYLDEKLYAEEMGFDGLMLNEHHSSPWCMGSVTNVEAAILARITTKPKIVILGNLMPLWDDPLWLAEELAIIDTISRGRLVTGWVRGGGRESVSHNAQTPYNWERFQEGIEFVVKTWTTDGPFRWEGKHYQYRYVNPWARPYHKPHPPIWIPGVSSRNTVKWAVEHRYPYVQTGREVEATRACFDYYIECAREAGWEPGPQNLGYMVRVHVDETEELADKSARLMMQGPSNPFLEGNEGTVRRWITDMPGLSDRRNQLPQVGRSSSYEEQVEKMTVIRGTPTTVIPKLRHVLEQLRPGCVFFWDGDGAMEHEDSMRSLRLFGEEVLPAVREIGKELELYSPYEVDPATGKPVDAVQA